MSFEPIKKVSEITTNHLAEYLRLEEPYDTEEDTLTTLLEVAKSYIKTYTGQEDLDLYSDFIIVIYILVQDMYDNRTLYVDKENVNKVVQSVLDLHSVNLL